MKRNMLQHSDLYLMIANFTETDRKGENIATIRSLEVKGAYVKKKLETKSFFLYLLFFSELFDISSYRVATEKLKGLKKS